MSEAPKVTLTSREPNKELRYEKASEWVLTIEIPGEPKPFNVFSGRMIVSDACPQRLALADVLASAWHELLYGKGSPPAPCGDASGLHRRSPPERRSYFDGYIAAMEWAEKEARYTGRDIDPEGDGHFHTVENLRAAIVEHIHCQCELAKYRAEAEGHR